MKRTNGPHSEQDLELNTSQNEYLEKSLLTKGSVSKNEEEETGNSINRSSRTEGISPKEEQRKAKDIKKSFRRLFRYSWAHKQMFIAANAGLLVSSAGMILLPLLCGIMIDHIKGGESLIADALYFAAMTVIMAAFSAIRGYAFMLLGEKVVLDMRKEIFSKLLGKDIEYYDQNKSGELVSRLSNDIAVVHSASSDNLSILMRNFLQFFGSLVFLWIISWKLTLLIIVLTPIISLIILVVIKKLKSFQKQYSDDLAAANSLASEVFSNIRVVRSFSNESHEAQNYQILLGKIYQTGKKKNLFYGLMLLVMTLFANGLILSILYFGGTLVIDGEITIGDLTSFVLYTITLTIGFASISGTVNQIVSAMGVCENLFQIMDHPVKIINGSISTYLDSQKLAAQKMTAFAVELDGACFAYSTKSEVYVLNNLTLRIKHGESVAIVGPSGSGKSSIVNLLLRFYDLQQGSLKISGVDIRTLNIDHLRRQVGYVSQEPTLFSGSIRYNVEYGLEEDEKSEAKTLKALQIANAKEFVMNSSTFPDRLNTLVGERGVKLSGGQKQRIAIARCVIKQPSLLIFDEATSALDAESEYLVQKAIDSLVQSRRKTMIIVAHRLSTIINCDRIVVLKDGGIVQEGTHKKLLKLQGVYASLVERQLSSIA